MNETFPQYNFYRNKSKLTYPEIRDILDLTVHLRSTWNQSSFKRASHRTWMVYKDKLTMNQKVILKEAIVQLRMMIRDKMNDLGITWLSKDLLYKIFDEDVTPNILYYSNRNKILKSYVSVSEEISPPPKPD